MEETLDVKFKKFSSIENTYRDKSIKETIQLGLDRGEWVALEKVHGSNFSFITDGKSIRCAKRSGYIEEFDSLRADDPTYKFDKFVNFEEVREKYRENILKLFELMKENNPEIRTIQIFGEIFGGSYPHKDVKAIPTAIRAQAGVFYCPHNDFFAFDIHDGTYYLDYDKAVELFKASGMLYAEPLFRGTFREALAFPNHFPTTLPARFGLPEIPDNFAEGVVLKPVIPKSFPTGSRVIFKNKTEAFTEKIPVVRKAPREIKESNFPPEVDQLVDELASLINRQRLENVISKIGEVSMRNFGMLVGLLSKDALEEFLKDNSEAFHKLEPPHRKVITKKVASLSSGIVNEYFASRE